MIDNVEAALSKACQETNAKITDYTGAPVYMKDGESGSHEELLAQDGTYKKMYQLQAGMMES